MNGTNRLLEKVFALRVQLAILCAEVIVYGGALEYALLYTTSFAKFVIINLYYHAQALYKEYPAEYW